MQLWVVWDTNGNGGEALRGVGPKNFKFVSHITYYIQGASRETGVFEMDVTEQVEGIETWVRGI